MHTHPYAVPWLQFLVTYTQLATSTISLYVTHRVRQSVTHKELISGRATLHQ